MCKRTVSPFISPLFTLVHFNYLFLNLNCLLDNYSEGHTHIICSRRYEAFLGLEKNLTCGNKTSIKVKDGQSEIDLRIINLDSYTHRV